MSVFLSSSSSCSWPSLTGGECDRNDDKANLSHCPSQSWLTQCGSVYMCVCFPAHNTFTHTSVGLFVEDVHHKPQVTRHNKPTQNALEQVTCYPICAQAVYWPAWAQCSVSVHCTHACVSIYMSTTFVHSVYWKWNTIRLTYISGWHSSLFRVHRPDIRSLHHCSCLDLHLQWIFVLPVLINSTGIVYYVPWSLCFPVMTWSLGK